MTRGARAFLLFVGVSAIAAAAWCLRHGEDDDAVRCGGAGYAVVHGRAASLYAAPLPQERDWFTEVSEAPRAEGGLPSPEWSGWRVGRRFRQPPAAAILYAPFAIPGRGGVPWYALCGAMLAAGVGAAAAVAARRLPDGAPAWLPAAAALLPLLPLLLSNAEKGQANALVLGLLALSVLALDRGRDRAAGLLAATAAALRIVPVLLVLWFLWKRRWTAAAWGLAGIAAIFYVLPVGVLGPGTAHSLIAAWAAQKSPLVTEVDERPGSTAPPGAVNYEGQSVGAVLERFCARTPFNRLRDRPLEAGAPGDAWIFVNGDRTWSAGTLRGLWFAAAFAVLAVVVLATGPVEGEDPSRAARRLPLEAGLLLASIALLSPESRAIHFLLLAPLLAALAASLAPGRGPVPRVPVAAAAAGALLLLLPSDALVGRAAANELLARGAVGAGGLLLFGAAAATLFRERRGAVPAGGAPAS